MQCCAAVRATNIENNKHPNFEWGLSPIVGTDEQKVFG